MSQARNPSRVVSHCKKVYGYVPSTKRFFVKTSDGWKNVAKRNVPETVLVKLVPGAVIVHRVSRNHQTYGVSRTGKKYKYNKDTKTWRKSRNVPKDVMKTLRPRRSRSKSRKSKSRKSKSRRR